jgi:hypothetical protein
MPIILIKSIHVKVAITLLLFSFIYPQIVYNYVSVIKYNVSKPHADWRWDCPAFIIDFMRLIPLHL